MRGAAGAHQHAFVVVLAVHEKAEHFLILGRRDIAELLAAAGADHEKDVEYLSSQLMGPLDDRRQLLIVHRLGAEVHLERQAVSLAGFDAGNGRFPGPGDPPEGVVLGGVQRIDADADAHHADLDQRFGHGVIDQHPVGAEHNHEAELHGMAGDVEDIGTHQRFSAGDDQQAALVDFGDLVDETKAFVGGELVVAPGRLGGGVEIAMVALEVAAFGQVEGDEIGLEVVDRAAVKRAFSDRLGGKELRDLLLDGAERSR